MYSDHVPQIASAMRADPDTFGRAMMFACLSARTQFIRMPEQMAELKKRGRKAPCLWGWKATTFDYVRQHGARLHAQITAAPDTETALRQIIEVPGLGIVKGAFVLQMLGHDIACLDTRNAETDGRAAHEYKPRKSCPAYMARKVTDYLADTGGKAALYWDRWCAEVAGTYKVPADYISAVHLKTVVPTALRSLAPAILPTAPLTQEIPF